MKLVLASISFDDVENRRIIYWCGEDIDSVGQLYLEDEDLDMDCLFDQAEGVLKKAYPSTIWDLVISVPVLCD